MISSIRNFLLKNGNGVNNGTESRKRKRIADEGTNEDDDVIVTAVKRPKFTAQTSGTSIYEKLFSSPYKKMADWVKSKTGSWSSMYVSRKQNQASREFVNNRNVNGGCPNGGIKQRIILPNRTKPANQSQHSGTSTGKMNGSGRTVGEQQSLHEYSVCSNGSQTDNCLRSKFATNSSQTDDVIYNGTTYSTDGKFSRGSQTFGNRRHGLFTANNCVLLEEKEQYKALLQQFTSVPLINSSQIPRVSTPIPKRVSSVVTNTTRSSEITRTNFLSRMPVIEVMKNSAIGKMPILNTSQTKPQESVMKVKVTPLQPSTLPKSATEDVVVIEEDTNEAQKNSVPSYQRPECLNEDWMDDLISRYSNTVKDRQRKIREEETKAKIYDERREAEEAKLEKRIRNRMKLLSTEPVIEDEPISDLESEDEEEKFPELTDKMMQEISMALRPNPPGEVLSEAFRIRIQRQDMSTLAGLNWLNDEVINFYMNLLMERGEKKDYPSIHAVSTFFYTKLLSSGYSGVRRWTKKVDIFSKDFLVIPVHLGMHWCLAIVDMKKKQVQYFDSMGGQNHQCLNAIKQYLQDESLDKRKQPLDLSDWSTEIVEVLLEDSIRKFRVTTSLAKKNIPQQMNGSDCGMFACKYAEYITRGAKITFTQEHMPYFRKRMVYEILKKQLLQ